MVIDDYVLEICFASFLFPLRVASRVFPVGNKHVSLKYSKYVLYSNWIIFVIWMLNLSSVLEAVFV